jgi:hypothetical protein
MNEDASFHPATANDMMLSNNTLCGFYFASLEQTVDYLTLVFGGT